MGTFLVCRHGWKCFSRDHDALPDRMPRERAKRARVAFIPPLKRGGTSRSYVKRPYKNTQRDGFPEYNLKEESGEKKEAKRKEYRKEGEVKKIKIIQESLLYFVVIHDPHKYTTK